MAITSPAATNPLGSYAVPDASADLYASAPANVARQGQRMA